MDVEEKVPALLRLQVYFWKRLTAARGWLGGKRPRALVGGSGPALLQSLSLPPCDLAVLDLLVQWSSPRSSKSLLYPVVFFFLVCLDQKIPLAQR